MGYMKTNVHRSAVFIKIISSYAYKIEETFGNIMLHFFLIIL